MSVAVKKAIVAREAAKAPKPVKPAPKVAPKPAE
jgi:hypothetical protein